MKRLEWIAKRGSPEQFMAFVTALDFEDEFENSEAFHRNLKEIQASYGTEESFSARESE